MFKDPRVEGLDREIVLIRQAIADAIKSFAKLDLRIHGLEQQQRQLVEFSDPIVCPNDHVGAMRVSVLEEVSKADPSVSRVVGGAFYCPMCGESFYYLKDRGRFKAPKPAEPPAGKPDPQGPTVKFRGGRER